MHRDTFRYPAPVPLFQKADFNLLAQKDPADLIIYLGSFWPYNTSNYESRLVKAFKESIPAGDFEPQIDALCEFYAKSILAKLPNGKIGYVTRALSSSETSIDKTRPQGILVRKLCRLTGAYDVSEVFYRSQARTPMRMVGSLSGQAVLRQRLKYAAQDLFAKPVNLGAPVLFVDDIANTGATMRLYSWALKELLGASQVWCANISITRYAAGKDGKGFLALDTSEISSISGFGKVYKDQQDVFHTSDSCLHIEGKTSIAPLFFAVRRLRRCPYCG